MKRLARSSYEAAKSGSGRNRSDRQRLCCGYRSAAEPPLRDTSMIARFSRTRASLASHSSLVRSVMRRMEACFVREVWRNTPRVKSAAIGALHFFVLHLRATRASGIRRYRKVHDPVGWVDAAFQHARRCHKTRQKPNAKNSKLLWRVLPTSQPGLARQRRLRRSRAQNSRRGVGRH